MGSPLLADNVVAMSPPLNFELTGRRRACWRSRSAALETQNVAAILDDRARIDLNPAVGEWTGAVGRAGLDRRERYPERSGSRGELVAKERRIAVAWSPRLNETA